MENAGASPYGEYFQVFAVTERRRKRTRRVLYWSALVVTVFGAALGLPVWWHLHQLEERRAWERELQEYVWMVYAPTEEAHALMQSEWVPRDIAKWYQERSEAVISMDFGRLADRTMPAHLADRLVNSPWPKLRTISHVDGNCWDGTRWLLPRDTGPVTALTLRDIELNDDALAALPVYPNLRSLDLAQNPVGDRGLAYVTHLPRLLQLTLDRTKVTDEGLKSLAGLRLHRLSLDETPIQGSGLRHLAGMKELEALSMHKTDLRDEQLKQLPPLPGLKILHLSGTKLDGSCLAREWNPDGLEFLSLKDTPLRGENLTHLRRFKSLQRLWLEGTPVREEGLEHLRDVSKLYYLNLNHTQVNDAGVRRLVGPGPWSPSIISLTLTGTRIGDGAGAALRGTTGLRSLSVDETAVGDAFVAGLAGHPTLQYLSLKNTRVSNACVPSLLALPALVALDVRDTRLTEAAQAPLKARKVSFVTEMPAADPATTGARRQGVSP